MRPRFLLSLIGLMIGAPVFILAFFAVAKNPSEVSVNFFAGACLFLAACIWAFIKFRSEKAVVDKLSAAIALEETHAFNRKLNTPEFLGPPIAISALLILIYGALSYFGKITLLAPTTSELYLAGAGFGRTVAHGEAWRLLTGMFLHASLVHLLGNAVALVVAGRLLCYIAGWQNFVGIYLCGGLFASLASAVTHPDIESVGASGAIFALFGALGAALIFNSDLKKIGASRGAAVYCIWYAARALMDGFSHQGIDNSAHVGGLIAGFAIMSYLHAENKSVQHQLKAFGGSAVAIALAAILILPHAIKTSDTNPAAEAEDIKKTTALFAEFDHLMREYKHNFSHTTPAQTPQAVNWIRISYAPRFHQFVNKMRESRELALPPKLTELRNVTLAMSEACLPMYDFIAQSDRKPASDESDKQNINTLAEQCGTATRKMNDTFNTVTNK